MIPVNDALVQLFQAHGVEAALQDGWVTFPQSVMRARAGIVREIPQSGAFTVQLDVQFEIAAGVTIFESFGAIGETREKAIADALQNFAVNSFHVLLAAFLRPGDAHVSEEEWNIGGSKRRVIVGNAGIKGELPTQGAGPLLWFTHFQEKLSEQHLGPETHWVRLYYGQAQNKPLACEVLLDNEEWGTMQAQMTAFAWQPRVAYYSIRLFLVIAEEIPDPLTPEGAVSLLARIAAKNPSVTDDELHQALRNAGVPDALAGRAVNFTEIAWGRVVLAPMGIRFSPRYFCFDAAGNVLETEELVRERSFAAASHLYARYIRTPAFQRLSAASADVQAVDNALKNGSSPERLRLSVMSPPFIFAEPPTTTGWEKAQKIIAEQTESAKMTNKREAADVSVKAAKPWRQPWKR